MQSRIFEDTPYSTTPEKSKTFGWPVLGPILNQLTRTDRVVLRYSHSSVYFHFNFLLQVYYIADYRVDQAMDFPHKRQPILSVLFTLC
jgi:hypothetical protein